MWNDPFEGLVRDGEIKKYHFGINNWAQPEDCNLSLSLPLLVILVMTIRGKSASYLESISWKFVSVGTKGKQT